MNKFKELRLRSKLTQEEFREKFNAKFNRTYTAAAISQFENGKRTPEVSALIDFADFYGVSLDYLLGRESLKQVASLSNEQTTVLNGFDSLNDAGRNALMVVLDGLRTVFPARSAV